MERTLVYIACAALLGTASCKPKYDEVSPRTGPVTEAVFASGSIEPKDAYTLTSLSDGFIVKAYVTEGDLVKDKELLFRLDNRQQNTQVAIAETNVEYARMNADGNAPALQQIRAQIDAAKVKLVADSLTLARYERLYTTRSVSKQDLDNAAVAYQSSLSSLRSLMENLRGTADRAKQELANSRSQLQNVRAGNQYYDLIAIGPGRVYQVFKKQGDLVRRGDKVAQIGNPDSIIIYLDIDEGSIGKIKEGMQVLVELNTDKGKTWEASISKIYPHFNEQTQSYRVEARFVKDVPGIISGTQLQANIVTSRKENALLIPAIYISAGNKVVIKKGDNMDTTVITTGIRSDEWVEVLSGVSAGDKLVKLK
ncbi:efflux RND transporter periplasmic adaptor subunit [Nemorincola caseinilytica]|uniref:Efflux RND transporter periplasmic adaptor subunit n=1 Tax=Nemorincola caseinilytica TaxID=2054315 RepID=A0ABP8N625_9BACT